MYYNAFVVSREGTVDEVRAIMNMYSKDISNISRTYNGYPSKIVWFELDSDIFYWKYKFGLSDRETMLRLLADGYMFETPEHLEYLYGIKVDKPQLGKHHQVYNMYSKYELSELITDIDKSPPLLCKDGSKKYTAKIKDIYYKHDMSDENYVRILKDIYENSQAKNIPFDEYCGIFENSCPLALISYDDILETDFYADRTNTRTVEENYNDFVKTMDSLDPELYVTLVDFDC